MAKEERVAREREEQQNGWQYRGGMMAEGTRTGEGGKDAEEERREEIKELREARKREARKKLCIISANVDGYSGNPTHAGLPGGWHGSRSSSHTGIQMQ